MQQQINLITEAHDFLQSLKGAHNTVNDFEIETYIKIRHRTKGSLKAKRIYKNNYNYVKC